MRHSSNEVPTRRVSETETNRGAEKRVNRKGGAPVGRPETTRLSSGSTSGFAAVGLVVTGIEGRRTHGVYFPSRAQGVGESAVRFRVGRPRD
jgi:hypothetical protein